MKGAFLIWERVQVSSSFVAGHSNSIGSKTHYGAINRITPYGFLNTIAPSPSNVTLGTVPSIVGISAAKSLMKLTPMLKVRSENSRPDRSPRAGTGSALPCAMPLSPPPSTECRGDRRAHLSPYGESGRRGFNCAPGILNGCTGTVTEKLTRCRRADFKLDIGHYRLIDDNKRRHRLCAFFGHCVLCGNGIGKGS